MTDQTIATAALRIAIACWSAAAILAAVMLADIRWRYTRNGGMRFLRVHRLQVSWCVCRTALSDRRYQ